MYDVIRGKFTLVYFDQSPSLSCPSGHSDGQSSGLSEAAGQRDLQACPVAHRRCQSGLSVSHEAVET